jgi:hypothetical protein
MSDESQRLRTSIAQLAGAARRRPDFGHPGVEDVAAYCAGELPAAAAEALLEHLSVCRECAQLAREVPAFLQPPAAAEEEKLVEARSASWEAFRTRLRAEPASPAAPPATEAAAFAPGGERTHDEREPPLPARPAAPARRFRSRTSSSLLALAAGLAVGALGLSLWIAAHGPSQKASILFVFPPEQQRGGKQPAREAPAVQTRLDAAATILVLDLPSHLAAPPLPYAAIRVELRGPDGAIRSPAVAEAINPRQVLAVLARHQLPPGEYRLRVLGLGSGRDQLIQEYPLRVLR